ncbi:MULTISPECIES: penicillin-binding transpeptidase domain-containing protein [unclassified Paenibacillus]|uniref:peptidoglycan D,D-transpeptidase FtsI family protein n=1 Tax=unclassified Paenibacillus TaxID=185978 RepID=UPI000956DB03|nr:MULTISPECIES: penicillin-binding transpeptidase domain-containing protein [unclassified Paenibacillus]ASS65569.1 penicillin-binding protein 2 [Paenibacillus sp. RUD330]SIQ31543.1 penicillin-binding protein 2 [Paenibacillus sp. RU4X]SIQ53219.1 penicillin-binding protein 2 [Paenibacillus sp. RU4T]
MKNGNGKPPQIVGRDEEKDYVIRRQFMFRLNAFFFAAFVLFGILIVRLAVLQFVEGPTLKAQREWQGTSKVAIPPFRGDILDSDKKPIAFSTSTQTLTYTVQDEHKPEIAIEMSKKLAEVFARLTDKDDPEGKLTAEEIQKKMDLHFRTNTISVPRKIKSDLNNKEIAYFLENKEQFKGVDIVEENVRNYDADNVAVQLVGYLRSYRTAPETLTKYNAIKEITDPTEKYSPEETVGYDGLEYLYQEQLRGKNGVKTFPVDRLQRIIGPPEVEAPTRGNDLVLTINRSVQLTAQKAMTEQIDKLRHSTTKPENAGNKAKIGFAVAMEVDTGKVVAMASMPDYDPNQWKDGTPSKEELFYFTRNGTIRSVSPPYATDKEQTKHTPSLVYLGSTQKPLSILIGLNEGLFSATEEYHDIGYYKFGSTGSERTIRNASNKANGYINASEAIAHSSNAFMSAMVGERLLKKYGKDAVGVWDKYMKEFGLGVSTESGLLGEQKGVEDYTHDAKESSNISALVGSSFGQLGKYTTLQLAQYASMLANKGKRMKPQFVNEILDPSGNVVQSYKPEVLNQVSFPDSYWNTIYKGMAKVSVQGFDGVSYSFLRKTGTSQQTVAGGVKVENSVFIAFAPADKPKLAVAIVIPEGGYGGWGAAPVARQIFDAYDQAVGLSGVPKKKEASTNP